MQSLLPLRTLAAVATLIFSASGLQAASQRALIVVGIPGSSANQEKFEALADDTKRLLLGRGFSEAVVLSGKAASREGVVSGIAKAQSLTADDEFWLLLLGHSGPGRDGKPNFQVSGPRLGVADLREALDLVPAKQYVMVGTGASGGYVMELKSDRRAVVSSTSGDQESDQPRFPEAWVKALGENPKSTFVELAARAAVLVEEEYKAKQLAQLEHARLADPVSGKILAPPFGVDLTGDHAANITAAAPGGDPTLIAASEIKIEFDDTKAQWERHPSSPESLAIAEAGKALANPAGHAAIIMRRELQYTVESDRTTDLNTFIRVYLARDEAADKWANHFFAQSPPMVTTKLRVARVIQPDGSFTAFNPAKLPCAKDPNSGTCGPTAMVFLPDARAGCVIEIGYQMQVMLDATLPHVSETLSLQMESPVLATDLVIRVPEKQEFRVTLQNSEAVATEKTEHGRRVYRWELAELPAAEMLPGDPPPREWEVSAEINTLPSWDEFGAWYRRLAKGSDAIDETVQEAAQDLSKDVAERTEKIRRTFEFVSALRYVAIEIGVQGFRPREPAEVLANRYGDCKDKANLLVALLRCQGIDAEFALVNRGGFTDTKNPSWQFNHALCLVPASKDAGQTEALWLDSTDSVTPFGFVPPGDYGRDALVIAKDGTTEFQRVLMSGRQISRVRDTWELRAVPAGGWEGSAKREATGLSEDSLRRIFRHSGPRDRAATGLSLFSRCWPDADVRAIATDGFEELGAHPSVRAEVRAPSGGSPGVADVALEQFSAPERTLSLWLNDGQPFALDQTVRFKLPVNPAPGTLPEPWKVEAGKCKFQISFEGGERGEILRVASAEFPEAVIAAADYPAVRAAVREWRRRLSSGLPDGVIALGSASR